MWRNVLAHWRLVVLVVTPLILLPFLVPTSTPESRCAYSVLLIAVYWISEALPLAITALIPIVVFPIFGIMSTNEVCITYFQETNMMFFGGLMVAIAVEESGLHLRVALRVLLLVGTSPRWIMLGFMLTTSVLSMWINNTATTAMMVPIIEAVLYELQVEDDKATKAGLSKDLSGISVDSGLHVSSLTLASNGKTSDMELTEVEKDVQDPKFSPPNAPEVQSNVERLRLGLLLSIAYAANIGGIGALNGTAPNLVLKGVVEKMFGGQTDLNFATFTLFGFPTMILCIVVAWIWLQILFIRPLCRKRDSESLGKDKVMRAVIEEKYKEMGPITFYEIEVFVLFVVVVLLWLFRDPKFIEGWQVYFPIKAVEDSTVVMAVVVLLFALPAVPPWKRLRESNERPQSALTWKAVQQKMPWSVLFLIGGGFAVAQASKVSGLSKWVGQHLVIFKHLSPAAITAVISLVIAMLTEIASNTATATIFLPVLAEMSQALHIHPLYTMLPATIACSFAFMLPIATPPNAIVFAKGRMNNTDMLLPGLVMNVLCVAIITLMINTLGVSIFDLNTFPAWAEYASINDTVEEVTTVATASQFNISSTFPMTAST